MITKSLCKLMIAIIIGLIVPAVVVLAQEPELEPCNNVVVDDYDTSELTISMGSPDCSTAVYSPTITSPENMTLPYPSYAIISNIDPCVNGPTAGGAPVSLFFEKVVYGSITQSVVITTSFGAYNGGGTLNGFILISSTGYYTPSTIGVSVAGAQGVASELWQIGPSNSEGNDGSLMREVITFTGITGDVIGVRVVSGQAWAGLLGETNIGRWEASGWCEKENGGGDTCTTVTDAHFTGTPSFEDGGWKLSNATTIHDSYIDIAADDFFKNTFEVFTPTQKTYTATVYARSATTQTSSIAVGISEKTLNGEYVSFDVDETVSDEFGIYTFVLSNSVPAGELGYIFIQAGEPGLQIDYICLEPSNGICADPDRIDYVYVGEDNQWDNGLHEWTPTEIDADLELPKLEMWYDDFRNPLHITGAYAQKVPDGYLTFWKVLERVVSIFKFDVEKIETIYKDDAVLNSIALKMPGEGMLESISVDVGHRYFVYGYDLRVFAWVNEEWVEVGSSTNLYDQMGDVILDNVDTITIPLQPVNQHTEYVLLSTVSFPDFNFYASAGGFYITKISTYGCSSGDAYTGQCIVSDESLDGGADGGPDTYYWQLFNGALPVPGGVALAAENMSYIAQNVYAANPGLYQLTVGLINDTSDRCELYARGTRETEYVEDDFFNVLLPCVNSTAVQTVTADVSLPDDKFRFILSANRGHATVTDICFHLPNSSVCLNKNPEFTDGTTGYEGGFSLENGRLILNAGTQIHAVPPAQTPFYSGNGPWVLQVTASSAISGDTVLSAITPGLNPVDTTITANQYNQISDTQVLTYAISLTDKDQLALTQTGNGPSVYNNDADGRLYVSKYCLMTDTGTTWWGNKDCTQVVNPDFLLGLTGWDSSKAFGSDWVTLDTGGYVHQRVMMDNMVSNGHFDAGYSGWVNTWSDTLSLATGYSGNGLLITAAGVSGLGARYQVSVTPNTTYTLFARVKASSSVTPTTYVGMYTTAYGTLARQTVTKNDAFASYIATGNVGSNSSINVMVFAGSATAGTITLDDVALVQGDTIPVQYTAPADATVHWIAKSGASSEITATVSVSSTNGVFTTTQIVQPGVQEFFTPFEIGGDVDLTVSTAAPGLELDFVCLNSGTYTGGPGGEGGPGDPPWVPGVGDGRCSPPPMMILTNTLTAWMPSIWIWSDTPSNYEVVSVYSAAWLRYIGCTLVDLQKMLEVKLNTIISKMGASTTGGWADALARIFEAIAKMVDAIAGIISQLLTLLITIWNTLAPGLGLVWQLMATLLELLDMIIRLLAEFAGWLLQMMMTLVQIVLGLMMDSATVPGEMLTAYSNAVNDPAYDIIPLSAAPTGEAGAQSIALDCSNPDSNYWCGILFGFQVVNQTLGASILYPMVIIGLILSTIFVFKNQLWEYYNVKIK